MWEPKHRLSLGVETGYYKVYEVQLVEGKDINTASLSVIPILFCVQMRIFKRFFTCVATGISIHNSEVNYLNNHAESQTLAFSNLQFSLGYIQLITKQFGLGLKGQFLSENKTEDGIFSPQAVARYQFKRHYKRIKT